ncbi:hypothetical protein KUL42_39390 [Alteromonas sp. KUL42]|uniref:hypothetical protein n=1 Tax=Alteromonas sp. KUL42 TaxID=2480797 RepID=UPI001036027C|nr:hypothetical protein [Alteromonas sp. KUL42]TAP31742.1 hypothetical protein EYR97_19845 [Alteromonas sp. KUL42]GEA09178.1 hypothetical protein KUL42_39390 [Alteromonas sp. KUL42]
MKVIIGSILLLFSCLAYSKNCEEMSKKFFLDEMDAIVGSAVPEIKERPKYIAKLLTKIMTEYPEDDATKCMAKGLEQAQIEKRSQIKRANSEI